jgi:acetoin utilization deacetylase AcuC-like enzyme
MLAFHSDHFTLDLPPGHSFPMSKYRLLREAVERDTAGASACTRRSRPATASWRWCMRRCMSAPWPRGCCPQAQQREIGFPVVARMAERARRSVGATIAAARAALAEGLAANLAGGTHHAYPDRDRATASSTTWRWRRG